MSTHASTEKGPFMKTPRVLALALLAVIAAVALAACGSSSTSTSSSSAAASASGSGGGQAPNSAARAKLDGLPQAARRDPPGPSRGRPHAHHRSGWLWPTSRRRRTGLLRRRRRALLQSQDPGRVPDVRQGGRAEFPWRRGGSRGPVAPDQGGDRHLRQLRQAARLHAARCESVREGTGLSGRRSSATRPSRRPRAPARSALRPAGGPPGGGPPAGGAPPPGA